MSTTSPTTIEHEEALLDRRGDCVTAEVYWDTQDPQDPGFAYRLRWETGREESGRCESPNPWQDVYLFLGPGSAYSDGTELPL